MNYTRLSNILITQAKPTAHAEEGVRLLMDYYLSYLSVAICFYAFDMIIHVDCDVAYLGALGVKNHIASYYYLNNAVKRFITPPPFSRYLQTPLSCSGIHY